MRTFIYFILYNINKTVQDIAVYVNQSKAGTSTSAAPSTNRGVPPDPAQSVMPGDKFTESDVKELISLGFSREQVISELRRFNGDKTQATAALFAKSLKF